MNWKSFLLGILLAGGIFFAYKTIFSSSGASDDTLLRGLDDENKKLLEDNKILKTKTRELKQESKALLIEIKIIKNSIKKLENELNQKNAIIDGMSTMDLYDYFARFKTTSKED